MCDTKQINSIQTPPVAFDKGLHIVQAFVKRSDGEIFNFYLKLERNKVANDIRDLLQKIEAIRTCECKNEFRCSQHI